MLQVLYRIDDIRTIYRANILSKRVYSITVFYIWRGELKFSIHCRDLILFFLIWFVWELVYIITQGNISSEFRQKKNKMEQINNQQQLESKKPQIDKETIQATPVAEKIEENTMTMHPTEINDGSTTQQMEKLKVKTENINHQVESSSITMVTKVIDDDKSKKSQLTQEHSKDKEQSEQKMLNRNTNIPKTHNKTIQTTPYKVYKKPLPTHKSKISQLNKTDEQDISKLQTALTNSKLLKQIFTHFCKQNYLSSIKSTLFEDKHKTIEEMSINKWMVFCKEFQIHESLCAIRAQFTKQSLGESQIKLQNSMVREQIRMKEAKQVNNLLTHIFHRSAQHLSKMLFPQFAIAIKLLSDEFVTSNLPDMPKDQSQFIKRYLSCHDEIQCLQKLSHLKFTNGIAQISYHKDSISEIDPKNEGKENESSRRDLKKTKSQILQKNGLMGLNSIIKDARSSLNYTGSQSMRYATKKMNLKLQQIPEFTIKQQKKGARPLKTQNQKLYDYFDSTHDDILQAYFQVQKIQKST